MIQMLRLIKHLIIGIFIFIVLIVLYVPLLIWSNIEARTYVKDKKKESRLVFEKFSETFLDFYLNNSNKLTKETITIIPSSSSECVLIRMFIKKYSSNTIDRRYIDLLNSSLAGKVKIENVEFQLEDDKVLYKIIVD